MRVECPSKSLKWTGPRTATGLESEPLFGGSQQSGKNWVLQLVLSTATTDDADENQAVGQDLGI